MFLTKTKQCQCQLIHFATFLNFYTVEHDSLHLAGGHENQENLHSSTTFLKLGLHFPVFCSIMWATRQSWIYEVVLGAIVCLLSWRYGTMKYYCIQTFHYRGKVISRVQEAMNAWCPSCHHGFLKLNAHIYPLLMFCLVVANKANSLWRKRICVE